MVKEKTLLSLRKMSNAEISGTSYEGVSKRQRDSSEEQAVGPHKPNDHNHSTIAKRVRESRSYLLELDNHVLLCIFDYLPLNALLTLCRVNQRLNELIMSHRIYRETITLSIGRYRDHDPKDLEMLPYATAIFVELNDEIFSKGLRAIATGCDNKKLRKITLLLNCSDLTVDNNLHHSLRDVAKNLKKLTMSMASSVEINFTFLSLFMNPSLESISFSCAHMTIDCFSIMLTLENLKIIKIVYCKCIPYEGFSEVMRKIGRNLESFTWHESSFEIFPYTNIRSLTKVIGLTMPNVKKLSLREDFGCFHFTEFQSFMNDLLALRKLQLLRLHVFKGCVCSDFNLFLNRLCSSRPKMKLHFAWKYMFASSSKCYTTKEELTINRCEYLLNIENPSLESCFLSTEWDVLKHELPNLRRIRFKNRIDFRETPNWERFQLMLKYGLKLNQVTLLLEELTYEMVKTLVGICKSDRRGKGITIYMANPGWFNLSKLNTWGDEYVKFSSVRF